MQRNRVRGDEELSITLSALSPTTMKALLSFIHIRTTVAMPEATQRKARMTSHDVLQDGGTKGLLFTSFGSKLL